jgi:hypothetical protein
MTEFFRSPIPEQKHLRVHIFQRRGVAALPASAKQLLCAV